MMGCNTSSPTTPAATGSMAAGNGSLKNGSVIEQANGIAAASATSNGHGNGSVDLDKMKSAMNDMLTDAANLDTQSAKKELEEVGENLREAVEEGTQELMDELSRGVQEDSKEEQAAPAPESQNAEESSPVSGEPGEPVSYYGFSAPASTFAGGTEETKAETSEDPPPTVTATEENVKPEEEAKEGTDETAQQAEAGSSDPAQTEEEKPDASASPPSQELS